jgi:hypothetical protein
MDYKIENTHKLISLTQRGFTCDYGGANLEGYWFKFIDRDQNDWGIELGNEVTDDGFISYCVFRRDTTKLWGFLHSAMILLRDITNPNHAMDLFTQLLHNQKTKI